MGTLAQALLAFRTRGFVAFSQDVTSSQTVNWPSGANTATIECYGAGGGGGAGTGNPAEGGGGRGGGYSSVTVTKGAETGLVVTIGSAGSAGITGSINGGPGGTTSVSQNGSTACLATGGDGGTGASANNGNGTGATTSNGTAVGTVTRNGGSGANGNQAGTGGAGGGGAGSTGVGGAGTGGTGGSAGGGLAGAGANGAAGGAAGGAGNNYGGGGAGGHANSATDRAGGAGAPGVCRLSWSYVPPAAGTSYANAGGTGDRTGIITCTSNYLNNNALAPNFVNGNLSESVFWLQNSGFNGTDYIRFDFGTGKVIDEAKFYQELTSSHGDWQWQGSNDGSSWTDIGSPFTLGGATIQTITALSGNTTAYRYYQILGVPPGSGSIAPYVYEFEFKIS